MAASRDPRCDLDAKCELPDPLAAFVQAAGQLAAAAFERGDRGTARRTLEDALRALDAGAGTVLRVLDGGRTPPGSERQH